MSDLFEETWQRLPLPDADVRYAARWLARDEADSFFRRIVDEVPWERHRLRIFGREVEAPRLSCWLGSPGAVYTYSGNCFEPHSWTPSLRCLHERVEHTCGVPFNSVLANLYRDGKDAMGWHSDDEPELGPQPFIASLSLGAERLFRFRRRLPNGGHSAPLAVRLPHGSLLQMAGNTQRNYQHSLPRDAGTVGPRINLTFRLILAR